MCDFVTKKEVANAREIFIEWITKVQRELRSKYNIRFAYDIIGSGRRKLVIRQCNKNGFFDLDYQITLTRLPKEYSDNITSKAKDIKNLFRKTFDYYKPNDFSCCEDSTQALTTKNEKEKIGYDIIIVRKDEDDKYILYNKKNTNSANNNDYCWEPRGEDLKYRERLQKIKYAEKWQALRNCYINKRHIYRNDTSLSKKKSFQILNEALAEVLEEKTN